MADTPSSSSNNSSTSDSKHDHHFRNTLTALLLDHPIDPTLAPDQDPLLGHAKSILKILMCEPDSDQNKTSSFDPTPYNEPNWGKYKTFSISDLRVVDSTIKMSLVFDAMYDAADLVLALGAVLSLRRCALVLWLQGFR